MDTFLREHCIMTMQWPLAAYRTSIDATSSEDPDDPEELAGVRVHTMIEGWTPALALDIFIILC